MQSYFDLLKGMKEGWYKVGPLGWRQKEERKIRSGIYEKLGGSSIYKNKKGFKGNSYWVVRHLG